MAMNEMLGSSLFGFSQGLRGGSPQTAHNNHFAYDVLTDSFIDARRGLRVPMFGVKPDAKKTYSSYHDELQAEMNEWLKL